MSHIVDPVKVKIQSDPELLIFKKGAIVLGAMRRVVIPLRVLGTLEASLIDSNDTLHTFTWQQGYPIYLASNSRLILAGEGKVALILMGFQHRIQRS